MNVTINKITYTLEEDIAKITRADISLTHITIPEYIIYANKTYIVKSIKSYAFNNCTNLKSIILPNSIESIEHNAFTYCTNIKKILIPNSIFHIGNEAFSFCDSLSEINISTNITCINRNIFKCCNNLSSIYIPKNITSINCCAFSNCKKLSTITVDENNKVYTSMNGILFSKDKSVLYRYPPGNTNLQYTIPASVIIIEKYAFEHAKLTNITIPNSVYTIKDSAFYRCYYIKSLSLPESVKIIENNAFAYCNNLTTLNASEIISIGNFAFEECNNLRNINIGKNIKSIGYRAFPNIN